MKKEDFKGIKYSPQTGLVFRNYHCGRNGKGAHSKFKWTINANGYQHLRYNKKLYKLCEIAVIFMTGKEVPKGMCIDHINKNKLDNRWCNLRIVTHRQNMQNTPINNEYIGARKISEKSWSCYLNADGETKFLGTFKNQIESHTAYIEYLEKNNIPFLPEIDKRIPSLKNPIPTNTRMGILLKKDRKFLPGAYQPKGSKKFVCKIYHNKKWMYLGSFENEYESHCTYMNYLDKHKIPYIKEIDHREGK